MPYSGECEEVYVGSSDVGVYLLHAGGELLLGRIFIRGGAGEFRTQIQSENVDGSGLRVDDCYGLTIMSWKMPGRVTRPSGRMRCTDGRGSAGRYYIRKYEKTGQQC